MESFSTPPQMMDDVYLMNQSLVQLETGSSGNKTLSWIAAFGLMYGEVHGYVALCICVLGFISNLLNVVVLNQKVMISPTNFLLTSLAISDGLLMTTYIPFAAYFIIGKRVHNASYPWAVFFFIHVNLMNLLHCTSSGIIIVLAVFRVLYVRCYLRCQEYCSMRRANIAVLIVLLCGCLLTTPCMITHKIVETGEFPNASRYTVTFRENEQLVGYLLWNTAIFQKLLPLVCLTVLSLYLIIVIRRRNIKTRSMGSSHSGNSRSSKVVDTEKNENVIQRKHKRHPSSTSSHRRSLISQKPAEIEREKLEARMTRLLLLIVLIFMVAFLPQAILLLLSGFLGEDFVTQVYAPLGDFTDLLTLVNNGVNFILYCAMSQQFRKTFLQLFCSRIYNDDMQSTKLEKSVARVSNGPRSFRFRWTDWFKKTEDHSFSGPLVVLTPAGNEMLRP